MSKKTELQKLREEIVRFMRGKYALDEVAGKYCDIDCLKFRQGKRTILSVNFLEEGYDFQIIFGKKEREKFESRRDEFSETVKYVYDNSKTYHDGKWMMFPVSDLETLEYIKQMILIKKNPNRKPFSKENAIYSKCGHRCDLCIHFTGMGEGFRSSIIKHLINVYNVNDWSMRCSGCGTNDCYAKDDECKTLKCAFENGLTACVDCKEYPCSKSTAGYKKLEPKNISADDVTWAILPYAPYQYGN